MQGHPGETPAHNGRGTANQEQRGSLDLLLARQNQQTHAIRAEVHPPLQLSRVRHEPACPHVAALTLVHLGGVLAGDRYTLHVTVEEQAAAHITTAAATQIYRMPQGHAEQTVHLRLGRNSSLAWLPEPTILFGGSDFRQDVRITLAAGARLAFLDVLVPGRLARGELFAFRHYASQLEMVDVDGRLLAAERFALSPADTALAAAGVLPKHPVVGSLYLHSSALDTERALAMLAHQADLGVTTLPNRAGLLVRAVGASGSAVRNVLLGALDRLAW